MVYRNTVRAGKERGRGKEMEENEEGTLQRLHDHGDRIISELALYYH